MRLEFTIEVNKSLSLDLLQLIPEKFRDSEIIKQLIEELNQLVGSWLDDTENLITLTDPYNAPAAYLKHLGSLINVKLLDTDDRTEAESRRELIDAVAWYKIKGTYEALHIIAGIVGYTLDIYDLYTDDYAAFHPVEWFVGNEDENPPEYDATYYKSPHFGLDVFLNYQYEATDSSEFPYLWKMPRLDQLIEYVEKVRPANTVPHFYLSIKPTIDPGSLEPNPWGESVIYDSGVIEPPVTQITGGIKTASWLGDAVDMYFDEGFLFDQEDQAFDQRTTLTGSITKWKIGTGHSYETNLERVTALKHPSGFALESVVEEGTSADLTITETADAVEILLIISDLTQDGITEAGLYEGDDLVVACLFPSIDVSSPAVLKITFTINSY